MQEPLNMPDGPNVPSSFMAVLPCVLHASRDIFTVNVFAHEVASRDGETVGFRRQPGPPATSTELGEPWGSKASHADGTSL